MADGGETGHIVIASMGPSPTGDGEASNVSCSTRPSVTRLQWGRRQQATESLPVPGGPVVDTRGFNGAVANRRRRGALK